MGKGRDLEPGQEAEARRPEASLHAPPEPARGPRRAPRACLRVVLGGTASWHLSRTPATEVPVRRPLLPPRAPLTHIPREGRGRSAPRSPPTSPGEPAEADGRLRRLRAGRRPGRPRGAHPSSQARPPARSRRRRRRRPTLPLRQSRKCRERAAAHQSHSVGWSRSYQYSGCACWGLGKAAGLGPGETVWEGRACWGARLSKGMGKGYVCWVGRGNRAVCVDSGEASTVLPPAGWPRARGCGEGEGPLPLWPRVERLRRRGARAEARGLLGFGAGDRSGRIGGSGLGRREAGGAARAEPTLPVRSTRNRGAS